jgi:uncharacterized protein Yka (UPF0111/DUF47 family)
MSMNEERLIDMTIKLTKRVKELEDKIEKLEEKVDDLERNLYKDKEYY